MTDDELERALRDLLDHDAQQVRPTRPHWNPSTVPDPEGISREDKWTGGRDSGLGPRAAGRMRSARIVVSAVTAGIIVVVVAAVAMLAGGSGDANEVAARPEPSLEPAATTTVPVTTTTIDGSTTSVPASNTTAPSGPDTSTFTTTTVFGSPPSTLGPVDPATQPPVTTVGGPDIYYRFASDIDLAWVLDGTRNMVCWRTPVDERCVLEPRPTGDELATMIVPTAADRTAILVLDGGRGARMGALGVTLRDATSIEAPVLRDDPQIDIGIARVDAPWEEIRTVGGG